MLYNTVVSIPAFELYVNASSEEEASSITRRLVYEKLMELEAHCIDAIDIDTEVSMLSQEQELLEKDIIEEDCGYFNSAEYETRLSDIFGKDFFKKLKGDK